MTSNAHLEKWLPKFDAAGARARALFGNLNETQLNWKPAPEAWSVGQCLDHLVTSNRLYLPIFRAIAAGNPPRNFWTMIPLFHGLWGKAIRGSVHPLSVRKSKTFPVFMPSQSAIPADMVENYARHLPEMIEAIRGTAGADHEKIIVISPTAPFVTYRLRICVEILTLHQERHLNQAERVSKMPGFPG